MRVAWRPRRQSPSPLYTRDVKFIFAVAAALILLTACGGPPAPSFDSLAEDFVYGVLALSPSSSTQVGYHQHKGVNLDQALDDYSPQGISRQREFYDDFSNRLA